MARTGNRSPLAQTQFECEPYLPLWTNYIQSFGESGVRSFRKILKC
jgi:hypothetical protein